MPVKRQPQRTSKKPLLEYQADGEDAYLPDPLDNGGLAHRPADNLQGETLPTTIDARLAFLSGVFKLMQGMSADDLAKMFGNLINDVHMDNSVGGRRPATTFNASTLNPGAGAGDRGMATEELDKLFADSGLSESTVQRLHSIFDIAVVEKFLLEREKLESEYNEKLAKVTEQNESDMKAAFSELKEGLDNYLGLVVETWINQNQIAIEDGIKVQLAESMMLGMKSLVESHSIKVSDKEIDIAEELRQQLIESTEKYNRLANEFAIVRKGVEVTSKTKLIENACIGLTQTQKDRVANLAENLPFENVSDFENKLSLIKESFLAETRRKPAKPATSLIMEDSWQSTFNTRVDPSVDRYTVAVARLNQNSK